ncbi:hypothetical protein EYF80_013813 [Liparis tanakae]|uniref:Uncharacterized protein n=1 Tax=Liparis tanakae TaxID=230148 RepID=A0A4Z2IDK8_9TELE|nr:hypothetical protein EYF80_013813 [Liparis tanakae]
MKHIHQLLKHINVTGMSVITERQKGCVSQSGPRAESGSVWRTGRSPVAPLLADSVSKVKRPLDAVRRQTLKAISHETGYCTQKSSVSRYCGDPGWTDGTSSMDQSRVSWEQEEGGCCYLHSHDGTAFEPRGRRGIAASLTVPASCLVGPETRENRSDEATPDLAEGQLLRHPRV